MKSLSLNVREAGEVAANCHDDDASALASIMSRLAVQLWRRGGGSADSFVMMATAHADVERRHSAQQHAQREAAKGTEPPQPETAP